jgi:hypothetical protein
MAFEEFFGPNSPQMVFTRVCLSVCLSLFVFVKESACFYIFLPKCAFAITGMIIRKYEYISSDSSTTGKLLHNSAKELQPVILH